MSARGEALAVLTACRVRGAWADAALGSHLKGLSPADAGLCSRIVYGVIQNETLLDFYLSGFCSQKLDHLQPPLADILRIGAYQILFLDRVPDNAAVHTSVELAKGAGRGAAAGLVNAVLRRLCREKEALPAIPDRDEAKYLSIRYSHPKWLVKRLLRLPLGFHGLCHLTWVKRAALIFGNPVICPSCTYHKGRLGTPLFRSPFKFALDWDTLWRLAGEPGRFVCVERPLMYYRIHDGATTKACIENRQRTEDEAAMYAKIWPEPVVGLLMHFYQKAYKAYDSGNEG